MRAFAPLGVMASLAACLTLTTTLPLGAPAFAQDQPGAADEAAPKQVTLTQKQIDGAIAAQKAIRDIESKMPQTQQDKPDPKVEAQIDAAIKKNGFASSAEYGDVSYSIGMVMAGMDPESGSYIGTQAAIKKQIAEVQADKKMPSKEKKEALAELNGALKSASSEKPLPGNVEMVKKNADKLSDGGGGQQE